MCLDWSIVLDDEPALFGPEISIGNNPILFIVIKQIAYGTYPYAVCVQQNHSTFLAWTKLAPSLRSNTQINLNNNEHTCACIQIAMSAEFVHKSTNAIRANVAARVKMRNIES